jgi:cytochrome P450
MQTTAPIVDFDDKTFNPFLFEEDAYGAVEDIYTPLAALRERGPVHRGDYLTLLGWKSNSNYGDVPQFTVTGYEEIMKIDSDPETFSIDAYAPIIGNTFGKTLSLMNPPDHTQIRRIFQKALLPHVVAKWGDKLVGPVVNALIDKFAARGDAELVSEFTRLYPFEIIYRQLALPARDIATFHKLAISLTYTYGDLIRYGIEASRKLGTYFTGMIAERRENPGDDLVSHLVQTEVDGLRIPDEMLISFFRQLINAAGDTTYRATGTLFIGLLSNPDQLAQVHNDRKLVAQAIEEALRWDGPAPMHYRMATRNVDLAGVNVPKGAVLVCCLAAANHDPAIFPNPERFDINRKRERNFGFGYGQHICVGQHLARLEMGRALNAILDRLPSLRFNPEKPRRKTTGVYTRTPQSINVLFN